MTKARKSERVLAMKTIPCPFCGGSKTIEAMFVVHSNGTETLFEALPCPSCDATGRIDAHFHQWEKIGRKMREDRIKREKTLRDEARERKINVCNLSRMECGLMKPVLR